MMGRAEYVHGPLCVWAPYASFSWKWKDFTVLFMGEDDFVLSDQENRTIGVYASLPDAAEKAWDLEQMYVDENPRRWS